MLVVLPFLIVGVGMAAGLCNAIGYSGWMLPVMLAVFFAVGFVGSMLLYVFILWIIALFVNMKKPQLTRAPFFLAVAKYTLGIVSVLAGVRLHTEGTERIPEGRWLLVSNHRSGFDPILTMWALRTHDIAFISKPSNLEIPIFGKFAHKSCCMAIDRENDREALRTILAAADLAKRDEMSVGVYPEGTRNRGKGLLPFRNGAFKIAQKAGIPIVVMTVEGTEQIKKNFPLRKTDVKLRIRDVIPAEMVKALKTAEIGDFVRRCMDCESV